MEWNSQITRPQLVVVLIVAGVLYLAAKSILHRRRVAQAAASHGCQPPRHIPQSETILGLSMMLESIKAARNHRFLELFRERFAEHGNTFAGSVMRRYSICTIEPENIRAILSTKFNDFQLGPLREAAFAQLTGRGGVFTSDGPAWQHSRALLRPSLSREQISDLAALERHVVNFVRHLPKHDDHIVDLQPLFFRLTLDNSTEFLFGESVNSLLTDDAAISNGFAQAFDYAQAQMFMRIRLAPVLFLYRNRKFDESCNVARAFVDRIVQRTLELYKDAGKEGNEEDQERYIFLRELAKETQDPEEIRTNVFNLLIAGRDTTGAMLSNALYLLSQNPDIWSKLRSQVESLNGRLPNYSDIRDLNYIRFIFNETQRLYPSIPLNARIAVRDTTLPVGGGADGTSPIFVEKGTTVTYLVHSLHRRKDIFGDDVDEFRPERWETLRPGWGFLPFNGGPRVCLGQHFAMTDASYILARLAQMYEAVSYKGLPYEEQLSLSLTNLHGVNVTLKSSPAFV